MAYNKSEKKDGGKKSCDKKIILKDAVIYEIGFFYDDLKGGNPNEDRVTQDLFDRTIRNSKYDNVKFIFSGHNISKFDNYFLMRALVSTDKKLSFKMQGNSILSLDFSCSTVLDT